MNYTYIIELEEGVYLADGIGDPARTTVKGNARKFSSSVSAYRSLKKALAQRNFKNPRVIKL